LVPQLGRSFAGLGVLPAGLGTNVAAPAAAGRVWRMGHEPARDGLLPQCSLALAASAAAAAASALVVGVTGLRSMGRGSRLRTALVPRRFFFGGDDTKETGTGGTIYGFTVQDIDFGDVQLQEFENKVVLIVNVASQ